MDISLPGDSGRVHGASARLDSARSACERDPVSPPERVELLALMDANMVAVYAADTRATPGGGVAETPGLVMCRTPHGTVATNMAIVTGRIDAPTIRSRTLAFYGPTGSPFSVWTREHADAALEGELGTLGFHPIHREPGMAFLPGAGRPAPPPPGATIRPVTRRRRPQGLRPHHDAGLRALRRARGVDRRALREPRGRHGADDAGLPRLPGRTRGRGRHPLHGARRGRHRVGRHPAGGVRARLRPGGHLGGDRGGARPRRALHEPPGLTHGRADVPPHGLHDPDALPLVPGCDVKARPARILPGWS